MINIEVNDYTTSVTAKGATGQLVTESLGLIIEGFKIIRKLNEKVYEKVKEELLVDIITGELDKSITDLGENYNESEMTVDLKELKKQLEQEGEEG